MIFLMWGYSKGLFLNKLKKGLFGNKFLIIFLMIG